VSKRIPPMSSKKFVKLLARGGAKFIRQKSTSHAIFERQKEGGVYRAPVVMAKKELSPKFKRGYEKAAALLSTGECVFAWASSFKAWLKDQDYVFWLGAGGFRVGT